MCCSVSRRKEASSGNAFTLLSHAERFLRDTLPIASRFETGRIQRIDEPLYPPLATREALANSLCPAITRWAADRWGSRCTMTG